MKIREYTADQALQLLLYMEVKFPGILDVAEQALKRSHLWPEDDDE